MRQDISPSTIVLAILAATLILGDPSAVVAQEFGPPAVLSDGDSGSDYYPQVTTDGTGNWLATWCANNSRGTNGTDADILVARSTDNGATWTAPAALNTNAATDSGYDLSPQITTDGAGNWLATWYSDDSLAGTIGSDYDILIARSTDNGATWTAPVALNTNAAADSGDDYYPQITTDSAGNWLATWYSDVRLGGTLRTDFDIMVARSTDNGATWTAPAALNTNAATDSGADSQPQITTDGAGNWLTTWYSTDSLGGAIGTDGDILVARSTDNGATWTAPAALNTNAAVDSGADFSPQVTTDGAGNWLATWNSYDSLGGTIGNDYDILVARSTDNGATWTAPAALNTNAADDFGDDSFPQITNDGAGNWVATWYSNDDLGGTIGGDIDILAARSTDNGATWTAPAALNTNAAVDAGADYFPQVTTDGLGNWVATWYSGYGSPDIFVALGGLCGDATLAGPEDCDDGGVAGGDCCSSTCTFEGPVDAGSCMVAPRTKLQITNSTDPAENKLAWQWSKGETFDQLDLGTPNVDTGYAMCVYDTSASVPTLVASTVIAPSATLWTSKAPEGYDYKDTEGTSDGVTRLQLRTGEATKTKVKLSATGTNLTLPRPFGMTYFAQSPKVIAQLVSTDGACWTSEFVSGDTTKNDAKSFKARTK